MSHSSPFVHVAAGVIFNDRGEFLLSSRPRGKVLEGFWEFAGGKFEAGEDAFAALKRELSEELGIVPTQMSTWLTKNVEYPHARVQLHFLRVWAWEGELCAKEGQTLSWQSKHQAQQVAPILPANTSILRALTLPDCYLITCAHEVGEQTILTRLPTLLSGGQFFAANASNDPPQQITAHFLQIREPNMTAKQLNEFIEQIMPIARQFGAKLLLNSAHLHTNEWELDGLHLTEKELLTLEKRPNVEWVGASVHSAESLAYAATLGVDFVTLGHVLPTPSHPNAPHLGWGAFTQLVQNSPVPVYALGGMTTAQMHTAREHGAHGIALMRHAWKGAIC